MTELKPNNIYNMDFREGIGLINEPYQVITDPPYNINFKYNSYKDNLRPEEYIDLIANLRDKRLAIIHYPEETMRYFVPALGVPDEVIAWCYNSNLNKQHRLINFYNNKPNYRKVLQPYKNPNDWKVKKLIAEGSKGTRLYDWFSDIGIVKNTAKQKYHPCPMPVELMERIILLTTEPNDLVVDTFGGSGTTAIACLNTGRRYILFEKDHHYYDIAVKRIEEHKKNMGESTNE